MKHFILLCVALLWSCALVSGNMISLAQKMNERLGYMKDVAGYKAQHHLPVEDVIQESKVINSSLTEAVSLGLDAESTRPFVIAQIDAAKAIQYRYRADWLSIPEVEWEPEPLEVVREKIASLSSEILQQLALQIGEGLICVDEREGFVSHLAQKNLYCADKMRLFDSLLCVRPLSNDNN
ncbi:Secreted chorismate mutase [Pseudolycoriella hygida]|uniref:chorismate mutase n=1 Tax=Pseudolycoriella hygida TaxID=35572 RepID=A0A9Q0S5M6_9DIPT|nr:Secreted chorismate mutase [Pseudolycoriella hygida]